MDDDERSRLSTTTTTDNIDINTTSVTWSHIGSINYDGEDGQSSSHFEVSDFLEFDNNNNNNNNNEWLDEYPTTMIPASFPENPNNLAMTNNMANTSSNSSGAGAGGIKERVAFRTKSLVEILDDGFKWRKYGKKMVKNSPNTRNYYRCSVEGCNVKKRVERDKYDPTYIITTYEGNHNHPSPAQILYLTNPPPIA